MIAGHRMWTPLALEPTIRRLLGASPACLTNRRCRQEARDRREAQQGRDKSSIFIPTRGEFLPAASDPRDVSAAHSGNPLQRGKTSPISGYIT
jgi:hypothetical protein